jgi:Ca2+/Na+ antiporter
MFVFSAIVSGLIVLFYKCDGTLEDAPWIRAYPALILFRIFMLRDTSMQFAYMLSSGMATLGCLMIIMLCFFFIYGVIGVTLFKGGYQIDAQESDWVKNHANFDDLPNAFITLTQLFLGEAYHEVMAGIRIAWQHNTDNDHNWTANWFALTFFFVMAVLFNNLFFGLLLNIFGDLYEARQDGRALTKGLIKETCEPEILDEMNEDELSLGDVIYPSDNTVRMMNTRDHFYDFETGKEKTMPGMHVTNLMAKENEGTTETQTIEVQMPEISPLKKQSIDKQD